MMVVKFTFFLLVYSFKIGNSFMIWSFSCLFLIRLYLLVRNSLFISINGNINTLLNDPEIFSWKEFFDDSGNKINQSLEEKLILIDWFACIVQKYLGIQVTLNQWLITNSFYSFINWSFSFCNSMISSLTLPSIFYFRSLYFFMVSLKYLQY